VALFRSKLLIQLLNIVAIGVLSAISASVGGWHIHSRESCQTRLYFDPREETLNIASETGFSAHRDRGNHCGI
jgi:hypothetical protein